MKAGPPGKAETLKAEMGKAMRMKRDWKVFPLRSGGWTEERETHMFHT
jgi:hypothetical protein